MSNSGIISKAPKQLENTRFGSRGGGRRTNEARNMVVEIVNVITRRHVFFLFTGNLSDTSQCVGSSEW